MKAQTSRPVTLVVAGRFVMPGRRLPGVKFSAKIRPIGDFSAEPQQIETEARRSSSSLGYWSAAP